MVNHIGVNYQLLITIHGAERVVVLVAPRWFRRSPSCHGYTVVTGEPYPWTKDLHMGGQTSDLVELIIRRVNGGAAQPDPLIAELERQRGRIRWIKDGLIDDR